MDNYNYNLPRSIEKHAKKLVDKCLNDVLNIDEKEINLKNKGRLGQIIEKYYFQYDLNSDKEADFKEAGVELKVTPVRKINKKPKSNMLIKRKGWSVKERIVLSIINYMELGHETWETNSLFNKIKVLLLMFYLYEKNVPVIERKFILASLWEPSEEDLEIIKEDWKKIANKVKNGNAHTLSEGDTNYLGACTKGSSAKSMRTQPFSNEPAKQRAFSYKRSYVDAIFEELFSKKKSTTSIRKNKEETIESALKKLFRPYLGKTVDKIGKELNLNYKKDSKQYYSILANSILGTTSEDNIEEFKKAGIKIKTIRVDNDYKPFEHMSFPAFKYLDLINEEWDTSTFKDRLENTKLFLVIYKITMINKTQFNNLSRKERLKNIKLDKILLWNMPMLDIEKYAKEIWNETRNIINDGGPVVTLKNNKRYTNFPGSTYNDVIHVRPHAQNVKDTYPLPNNREYTKHSFWLDKKYLMEQIKKNGAVGK